jgi:sRNA-binding protein
MGRNAIVAVISLLAEKWPCCFSIPESRRRPLKLGIREDVLASLDGAIPAGKVSAALRWYVSSPEYQRRLVHGAWRVDLNGRPAGTVSEEDEAHARALLFAMQPKPPERARASSHSEPQRVEQTLQTEQRNVPAAVGEQRTAVRGLGGGKRRSPLMTRPAKQACRQWAENARRRARLIGEHIELIEADVMELARLAPTATRGDKP